MAPDPRPRRAPSRASGLRAELSLHRRVLRASLRRPARAVAILASLVVMSAATVGALVAAEGLDRLFAADAAAEWGVVDLEARADDDAVHQLTTARLLGVEGAPDVIAAAPRLILRAVASNGGRVVPSVGLIGVGAEEQGFPPLEAIDGLGDPLVLGPDEVILAERLAERLAAAVGDRIDLVVAVVGWREEIPTSSTPLLHPPITVELALRVRGIVADTGVADLHRIPNALVRRDVLGRATGLDARVTVTHLRVASPGAEGARAAIDRLAPVTLPMEIDVDPVAVEQRALAEEEGGLFRSILLTLATLIIAAAVVATRGLLVTLAEERALELALLRAHGCRRRLATRLLTVEAAIHGVIGGALGILLGIPLGRLLAGLLSDHLGDLGSGRGREQVPLEVSLGIGAALLGAGTVAVVAVLAGRSAARMVLASPLGAVLRGGGLAVRPPPVSRRRAAVVALIGAFLLGIGALTGPSMLFIALTTCLGAWWLWGRAAHEDPASLDRRAAVAGLVWALAGGSLLADPSEGVQAGFGLLVVAGLTAILSAALLTVERLPATMRLVRAWVPLGWPQAALRTAASQAAGATRRSTTTVLVLGGVLFMVAALSVLGSAQALPLASQSGGYDVVLRSVARLDQRDLGRVPGVAAVGTYPEGVLPETAYGVVGPDGRSAAVPYPVRIAAATTSLVSTQAFDLAAAAPGVETAATALDVLVRQRGSAVVDRAALPEGAAVGDEVVLDVGIAPRRLRLIAVLDTFLLSTVWVNEADLALASDLRGPTAALVRAQPGTDPAALAAALQDGREGLGVIAEPLAVTRDDVVATNRTFTDTFSLMLVLALAVATASLAAYVLRAARERRAELAVLSATGMPRRAIVLVLAAEPALTALVGMVAGLAIGLGLLWLQFRLTFSDLAFVVDWTRVTAVSAGIYLLVLLACGLTAALTTSRDLGRDLRDLG